MKFEQFNIPANVYDEFYINTMNDSSSTFVGQKAAEVQRAKKRSLFNIFSIRFSCNTYKACELSQTITGKYSKYFSVLNFI